MSKRNSYTIQDLIDFAKSKEGECLSETYVNTHHKYVWKCKAGHTWEAPFSRIKSGAWCRACFIKKQAGNISGSIRIQDLIELAESREGICLSNIYINSKHKYQWRCKEGHTWEATYSRINSGGWCPVCAVQNRAANKRKYSISDMKKLAEKHGGECLSEEFIAVSKKLIWRCGKGHVWEAIATPIIRNGTWCPTCARERAKNPELTEVRDGKAVSANVRRLTIEDARHLAEQKDGQCLSENYINVKTYYTWKCKEGHVWESTYDSIARGTWCRACAGLKRNTIEDAQHLAAKRNGKCLSTKYKNARDKLKWMCSEGHVFESSYGNVNSGKWCAECAGHKPKTIEDARRIAKSREGKCLSDTYINAHEKLKWECSNGHVFEMNYNNVQQGKWCGYCHRKLNEQKCRFIFESFFDKEFPSRWDVLGNGYELDGYNEELKLAFEFQGIQHYKKSSFFHRKQGDFEAQIIRDNDKREMCKRLGILLLEIPHNFVKDEDKIEYIYQFLINNGFKVKDKKTVTSKMDDFYKVNVAYEELVLIAEERNGRLLSKNYNGVSEELMWSCKKGHRWLARPGNIKRGRWCPECGRERIGDAKRKYSIEDMKDFAKAKGGECLSSEFKNVIQRLNWKCAEGHTWTTAFNVVNNGAWCPHCAGNVKKNIRDAQHLAIKNGGQCLSTEYKGAHGKLTWKCGCGYVWNTTYHQIDTGSWCPKCARESRAKHFRKYTIEDMRTLAATKNGDCLSEEYESYNKNLQWRCENGHQFEKSLSNFKKGQWCSICSKQNRKKRIK
ncbi:zinc-ribbon domain-containing protein [Bacillus paranthracis]|uniref:zinc-ribbon domain-containing protein n=1 Tax=Bacillus paranthracis TaxID=2026186 RepID=UPI0011A7C5A8|nr:zinc-ribbon domain-containing protein [Bacillus paranthracis]